MEQTLNCILYFLHIQDREQIVLLLVETIKQLSVAATGSDESAKKLWENLFALMTDSVSKNLKIEDGISESLGSTQNWFIFPASQTQWKSWILITWRFWQVLRQKSSSILCWKVLNLSQNPSSGARKPLWKLVLNLFSAWNTQAFRKCHPSSRYIWSYLQARGSGQTSFFIPTKMFYQVWKIFCIPTWSLTNPENVGRESNRE